MSARSVILSAVLWMSAVPMVLAAAVTPAEVRRVSVRGLTVEAHGVSKATAPDVVRVLEDQLGLSGDAAASAPLADDLAFFVRGRYFQLGHAEADVEWAVVAGRIVLTVEEGPVWRVGTVRFDGAEGLDSAALEAYLLRPTRERRRVLARTLPFVEADIRAGTELVVRHVQALGYLEAAAAAPVIQRPPGGGAVDIEALLKLGRQSLFGTVTLEGETGPLTAELRAGALGLNGKPFNEVTLEGARSALKGGLQARGYFAAEVAASIDHDGASGIPVTLTVMPGRRYAVRAVQVEEALGRGATRVARSVFSAATDQTFDPETIDLLHRRALDTGIFSRLEIEPVAAGDGILDLHVSGEEAKPKTLGFYGGYESLLGPILGIETRHVNYLDSGNAVAARLELRGSGGEGGIQVTDPAVFGSRWALGTGLSYETFTFADYDRQTAAWRSTLTRRVTRRITSEAFATVSYNEMDTDVLSPEELGPGKYSTASGGLRLTLDFRDHPLLARDGWLLAASAEGGAVDGDEARESFIRGELTAGWYQPLSDRWRVSLGARARVLLTPAEVGDFPIDLRIFNGGASSVRSFAERELGPMSEDGETPLGGLAAGVLSAEISYEVVRNLELAAFADAGSLGEDSATFFEFDDLRYGVGLGVRYRLPVGPLRIDYGINPDRRDGEAFGALHVTFGFAF